jgi:hypothetical protein
LNRLLRTLSGQRFDPLPVTFRQITVIAHTANAGNMIAIGNHSGTALNTHVIDQLCDDRFDEVSHGVTASLCLSAS